MTSYAFFYFAQLSVNAMNLAFYGIMVFSSHATCANPFKPKAISGTSTLMLNFIVGFLLQLVNFIVLSFVEPHLRAEFRKAVNSKGMTKEIK